MTSVSPESSGGRVGLRAALSRTALRLQSDRRLVALTRAGSGTAFSVIAERYRGPLMTYCRRLLGPDEAEDALQQTLVNALGALRRDDREMELRPWLYRIAHNVAVNTLRRSGRHHEQLDDQFDGVPQPPDVLDEKLQIERLVKGIRELPERQREAVIARELEGRSYEEIAQSMDATAPVVRQLIYRARTRLRDACGVLVPAWALRWMLVADLRTAGSERVGDAVAGGAAGAGLLKAGTALLATGAIATGAGGLVTSKHHHRAISDQQASSAARPEAQSEAQSEAGPASPDRQPSVRPAGGQAPERHPSHRQTSPAGHGHETDRSHGEREGHRAGSGDDDRGDAGTPEHPHGREKDSSKDGDGESGPDDALKSSHDEADDNPQEGESHGDAPSDHSGSSEESNPPEDSGSQDPPRDEPAKP